MASASFLTAAVLVLASGPVALDEGDSGIIVGPLPLAQIQPVHLEQPIDIVTRGQPQPYSDLWLLISAPLAVPTPPRDAGPPPGKTTAPVVMPILHVDEHRAKLVYHDRVTGVFGWLAPKVELEKAFVWHLLMTEDSVRFWEKEFWAKAPSVEQIAASAQLLKPPGDERERVKIPTYLPEEIATAKGHGRATLHSLEQVRSAVQRAAAAQRDREPTERSGASQP